jgi:hypothetical protein
VRPTRQTRQQGGFRRRSIRDGAGLPHGWRRNLYSAALTEEASKAGGDHARLHRSSDHLRLGHSRLRNCSALLAVDRGPLEDRERQLLERLAAEKKATGGREAPEHGEHLTSDSVGRAKSIRVWEVARDDHCDMRVILDPSGVKLYIRPAGSRINPITGLVILLVSIEPPTPRVIIATEPSIPTFQPAVR